MATTAVHRGSIADIQFQVSEEGALSISMKTKRLYIRSIEESDFSDYVRLFGDEDVMRTYSTGVTQPSDRIAQIFNENMKMRSANNPYHVFSVFLKEGDFVGITALTEDTRPGIAELSVAVFGKYWGSGYGTEVVKAILQDYVPVIKQSYLVHGEPLHRVFATAQVGNMACYKILREKIGMHVENPFSLERTYCLKIN